MKKFLTFILVLAMVMSVSSFAMAVDSQSALQAAIDGAAEGAETEIVLTGDVTVSNGSSITIPAGKVIVIDLAGNDISQAQTILNSATIINSGNLTVKDSVGGGKITSKHTGDPDATFGKGVYTVVNSGTMTVNGGTIENLTTVSPLMRSAIDNQSGSSDAYLTINAGATISCPDYVAIRQCAMSESKENSVIINDGEVSGKFALFLHDTSDGDKKLTLKIDGGTINGTNNSFYVWDAQDNSTAAGMDIEVNAGHFTGDMEFSDMDATDVAAMNFDIAGGTFDIAPDADLIADGSYTATITANNSDVSTVVGATEDKLKENLKEAVEELIADGTDADKIDVGVRAPAGSTDVDFETGDLPGGVELRGDVKVNGDEPVGSDSLPMPTPELPQVTNKPSSGSGISVKYNGGNSFSTSNPAVPTGVEIDGVPVTFNGTGSNFTVGCISSDAKWVTVRWNSTTVTTNFTPDGLVECTTVSIPKTGDMPFWVAVAAFFGF